VIGGAVHGGDLYGRNPQTWWRTAPTTPAQGRWIPTTSVDEYSATLARWFGVGNADMGTIFPIFRGSGLRIWGSWGRGALGSPFDEAPALANRLSRDRPWPASI